MISVLVRRSCGDPVEIILKRSLHKDPEDALRWRMSCGIFIGSECFYEILVKSSV
jgi:hypothetical protein